MKKIFLSLIVIAILSSAILIGGKAADKPEAVRIGISKLMAHPALDSIEKGIIDYLAENGIDAEIETQNANGVFSSAFCVFFQSESPLYFRRVAIPPRMCRSRLFSSRTSRT